jgi:hypothetical protein
MQLYNKPKKCKQCGREFVPSKPMQKACSVPCALEMVAQANEKKAAKAQAKDRQEVKQKLDAMRTKPQLVKLAQTAFNAYIRARDAGKPCICCGKPLGTEPNTFDAGHYRSVGSAPHMRFVEDNVHGQNKYCNNYLGGNHVEYRKGLIERIGLARVEQIEADNTIRKYTHEGLIELARHYNAEARRLKKGEA